MRTGALMVLSSSRALGDGCAQPNTAVNPATKLSCVTAASLFSVRLIMRSKVSLPAAWLAADCVNWETRKVCSGVKPAACFKKFGRFESTHGESQ